MRRGQGWPLGLVGVSVSSKLEPDVIPLQRPDHRSKPRRAEPQDLLSATAIATVCTPNSRLSRAIWPRFSLRDGIPASTRTSDAATLSFCRSGAARSSVGSRHSVNGVRRCTATTAGAGRVRLARLVGGADATALRAVAWETRRQSEQEDRSTTASSAGQDGLIQSSSNARHAEESTVRRLSMPRHCSGQHLQRVNGSSIALAQCDPAPGAPRTAVLAFRGRASQLGCHCDKAAHSARPLSSAALVKEIMAGAPAPRLVSPSIGPPLCTGPLEWPSTRRLWPFASTGFGLSLRSPRTAQISRLGFGHSLDWPSPRPLRHSLRSPRSVQISPFGHWPARVGGLARPESSARAGTDTRSPGRRCGLVSTLHLVGAATGSRWHHIGSLRPSIFDPRHSTRQPRCPLHTQLAYGLAWPSPPARPGFAMAPTGCNLPAAIGSPLAAWWRINPHHRLHVTCRLHRRQGSHLTLRTLQPPPLVSPPAAWWLPQLPLA